MSRPALVVDGIGKQYRLGSAVRPMPGSLYELLEGKLPFLRTRHAAEVAKPVLEEPARDRHLVLAPSQMEDCPPGHFWALRDVSFEVKQGDRIGIVGKNGSGKSTLLKILSRVTPPSRGRFSFDGRLVSLLEVGTGFHPDLSGRENIFLNAQINGMTPAGVRRIFDEIVEFSELGKQIDTPIKRYSSGMYMRLAFSVAAHLDSEILIVDEVLAVGDAGFQKKCLDKMLQVTGQGGRTLLFVSHDMSAISSLCTQALELEHGRVVQATDLENSAQPGPAGASSPGNSGLRAVDAAIADYVLENAAEPRRTWPPESAPRMQDGSARIVEVAVLSAGEEIRSNFRTNEPVKLRITYDVLEAKWMLNVHFYLKTLTGQRLLVSMDNLHPGTRTVRAAGRYQETCTIAAELLNEGTYRAEVVVCTNPTTANNIVVADVVAFTLEDDMSPDGLRGDWVREWPDYPVRTRLAWDIEQAALPD